MFKKISILGSTGSIGTQALEVSRHFGIEIIALSANSNIDLLYEQILEFKPRLVSVKDSYFANKLNEKLKDTKIDIEIAFGEEGLSKVAQIEEAELVLTSIVGSAGLVPTLKAIERGKTIALANKETLVTAGKIVMDEAKKRGVQIIPVDSEHSAIYQCLMGNDKKAVNKIILTASGGPFRGKNIDFLKNVSVEQALNHPNWKMGNKITIDSATLMNKGLEVIEAYFLFDIKNDIIDVVVHPQSIIHSMVEYLDGSIIAQLGTPDMKIPIQFALTYPDRLKNDFPKLDFTKISLLSFEQPDLDTFRCLKLAFDALKEGGTLPAVLNAANEIAVSKFLNKQISFTQIPDLIEEEMILHNKIINPTIEDILEVDRKVRERVSY